MIFSILLLQPKICNFAYFSWLCDMLHSSQPLLNHCNNISSRVDWVVSPSAVDPQYNSQPSRQVVLTSQLELL